MPLVIRQVPASRMDDKAGRLLDIASQLWDSYNNYLRQKWDLRFAVARSARAPSILRAILGGEQLPSDYLVRLGAYLAASCSYREGDATRKIRHKVDHLHHGNRNYSVHITLAHKYFHTSRIC